MSAALFCGLRQSKEVVRNRFFLRDGGRYSDGRSCGCVSVTTAAWNVHSSSRKAEALDSIYVAATQGLRAAVTAAISASCVRPAPRTRRRSLLFVLRRLAEP